MPDEHSRNRTSIDSERTAKLDPAVYFFAGRPYPHGVGGVALALTRESVARGEISPFDSGGVVQSHTRLPSQKTPEVYIAQHTAPIGDFVAYFGLFLSAFFGEAEEYWKCPNEAIDGVPFGPKDDWRDWTFEVRSPDPVPLAGAKWFFSHESYSDYLGLLEDLEFEPLPADLHEHVDNPADRAKDFARERIAGV